MLSQSTHAELLDRVARRVRRMTLPRDQSRRAPRRKLSDDPAAEPRRAFHEGADGRVWHGQVDGLQESIVHHRGGAPGPDAAG